MTATIPPSLLDLTRPALGGLLQDLGFGAFHRDALFTALHRTRVTGFEALESHVRPPHLAALREHTRLTLLEEHAASDSSDGHTHKVLLRCEDGQTVETVLMRFKGRYTACVSTQAGCAMGCVFCATGQMGFFRHLTPGEIVAQVLHVCRILDTRGEKLRNIVLMGMGEPLHTYDSVMTALDILQDPRGVALGPRFVTLSTVGVVPGIRRLAREARPLRLAVSLHGATEEERAALVPIAKKWPLAELIDACREYTELRDQKIFFEWALIAGKNDTPETAHTLGALLEGIPSHVNLIPLNPTKGYDESPSADAAVKAFQQILATYGLPSTVRQRRGIDIDAGCGQLRDRMGPGPREQRALKLLSPVP